MTETDAGRQIILMIQLSLETIISQHSAAAWGHTIEDRRQDCVTHPVQRHDCVDIGKGRVFDVAVLVYRALVLGYKCCLYWRCPCMLCVCDADCVLVSPHNFVLPRCRALQQWYQTASVLRGRAVSVTPASHSK